MDSPPKGPVLRGVDVFAAVNLQKKVTSDIKRHDTHAPSLCCISMMKLLFGLLLNTLTCQLVISSMGQQCINGNGHTLYNKIMRKIKQNTSSSSLHPRFQYSECFIVGQWLSLRPSKTCRTQEPEASFTDRFAKPAFHLVCKFESLHSIVLRDVYPEK